MRRVILNPNSGEKIMSIVVGTLASFALMNQKNQTNMSALLLTSRLNHNLNYNNAVRSNVMRQTRNGRYKTRSTPEKVSNELNAYLEDGTHRSAAFKDTVHESKEHTPIPDNVIVKLAKKAIRTGHAKELDILAKEFPDVITPDLIRFELKRPTSSSTLKELLVAKCDDELEALNYLFDPRANFVIVEEGDTRGISAIKINANQTGSDKDVLLVDADQYDARHVNKRFRPDYSQAKKTSNMFSFYNIAKPAVREARAFYAASPLQLKHHQ